MDREENYQPLLPQWQGYPSPVQSQLSGSMPGNILPPLLEDVDALNIRQLLSVARRRIFLMTAVSIAVTCGVLMKVLTQTPIYEGNFRILVEPVKGEEKFEQINQTLARAASNSRNTLDYQTQIEVLLSEPVLQPVVNQIQVKYPDFTQEDLAKNIKIIRPKETKILDIRYQDTDREKIKFILARIAEGYVQYSKMEQQTSLRQGLEFVDQQLPVVQQRVDALQKYLEEFRQHYNLIDPEQRGQILSQNISNLVKERQETESQIVQSQALYSQLKSQLGINVQQGIIATSLSEATRYQQLLNQLQEIERKIATESVRFTANNPSIQVLLEQRNNLLPLLQEEALLILGKNVSQITGDIRSLSSPNSIRSNLTKQMLETVNQMEVLRARQWAIAQAEKILRQQIQEQATLVRQYTDLQRELQVATDSLSRFLAVRENLQIEAAQNAMPWRIIALPNVPENPISPNVTRSLILGAIAGLLAGIGAALLAEKLDTKFHSADEIKNSLGFPLLGIIPFQKELPVRSNIADDIRSLQPSSGYSFSEFSESFRSLHADLYFMSPDKPLQSIVISSALPAEGKTTIAVNLAEAAAAMGNRVLLIDADLRNPSVDRQMGIPNLLGLSNLISNEALNADDIIQQSANNTNLFVLTAGQTPPDPARLLSSQKMQKFIQDCQRKFDLVIVDTPPLGIIADAKFVSAHTDGLMMVVRLGQSDRAIVREVIEGLKISRTPVIGIVINGEKRARPKHYHYYHRYYTGEKQQVLPDKF